MFADRTACLIFSFSFRLRSTKNVINKNKITTMLCASAEGSFWRPFQSIISVVASDLPATTFSKTYIGYKYPARRKCLA